MIKQSLIGSWQFRQIDSMEWLPAVVPGGVHTDPQALEQIPDPFVSDHEKQVQWIAESDWEYRRSFAMDETLLQASHLFLVCDGLDTLAEVTLNDQLVARTDNMFRQYRWNVKVLLRAGENELRIVFRSPVAYVAAQERIRTLPHVGDFAIQGGAHLRKAPSHFGWDWGPMLPAIGIWRDIRLEGYAHARLSDIHLRQQHDQGRVTITADVTIEQWDAASLSVMLRLTTSDGSTHSIEASPDQTLSLPIEDPQLWWPNCYGDQPLYRVEVILCGHPERNHAPSSTALHSAQNAPSEVEGNETLDQREYSIGLRTIELRQRPDRWGCSFTFVVNGVPIFAKGSNWIPADSFPTRVTPEQLDHLIGSAAQAHHNMLRIWGGGYYEDEALYDACDRYGILVWQDFMFACAGYPLNDASFLETVQLEVEQAVRRLRHRACLALWCGNNEMETGWVSWGWNTPANADLKAADQQFFYATLPALIAAHDPDHAYWPSSPSSGLPHEDPNSDSVGDNHLWEVWHALKPLRFYREQYPRFASEFGMQSLPTLSTIATYADESEWNMTSYVMEHHQRHRSGNGKIIAYLTDHFRLAKDFPLLVYLTQVLQAEAMRIGVEHWRRNRDRCSGTLYWQLNDCWPVASWSSIDYYGRWKALHYVSRRFYAPVLLSVEDDDTRMGIFITNDMPEVWQGEVHWSLQTVNGAVIESGYALVVAAPLATTSIQTLDFAAKIELGNRRDLVCVCELWQDDLRMTLTVTPFVPDKHLRLEEPKIETQIAMVEQRLVVQLHAESLARLVELSLDGADVIFSDNYFDLPAHEVVRVTCPLPKSWTIDLARQFLRVRSLFESY